MLRHNLALASGAATVSGSNLTWVIVVAVIALCALGVAGVLVREVLAASQGTPKMREISLAVREGAAAYLRRQFRTLGVFVVVIFFVLAVLPADSSGVRWGRSAFFLVGALFSALTGFTGMSLTVRGNVRVAAAAKESGEHSAMRIAFRTGGVAGMFTVGLGLFGAAVVVLIYKGNAPSVLEGFGFGAALLAMFMRVGGGIYTKAADVGADLVGKVEKGIPEDDPRNAATIADNVGDNVGDCAGMAADLFESYSVMLVASLILGKVAFGNAGLVFPLIVPMIGVITAVVGIFAVAPRKGDRSGMTAINRGFFISAVFSLILVIGAAFWYLPAKFSQLKGVTDSGVLSHGGSPRWLAIGAVLIGLVLASAIQLLTGYFTETNRKPVREIGEASETGAATVILSGIATGLESAVYSALLIGAAVYGAFLLGTGNATIALFAVALAGTGLLTTVGVIVSMDSFGPVTDNAQGIAEMSGEVEGEAAQVLTHLDAVGNTTKAITKGIAIATAVLAATALFGAFRTQVQSALGKAAGSFSLSIDKPNDLVGLIIGGAVVFLFASLLIRAVGRAAGRVVLEVRNQFRIHPGIMDYTEKPDYGAVVDICTRDSLRELVTPGLLAVLTPIAVGFAIGYAPLGSFLAGAIGVGVLMAVFLANSGGAWDNAKKLVEDGHHGGKGSEAHAATVIGDTVGDPFKDTAGPAINPLIKVMNLVSLLIATSVVRYDHNNGLRAGVAIAAVVIVVAAVVVSKRRSTSIAGADSGSTGTSASGAVGTGVGADPVPTGSGQASPAADSGKTAAGSGTPTV
jgi:K(+)-stimulated pyrophosphate-energized sodium pump